MFRLFSMVISYGTFLLMLMPATLKGIAVTAALFVIGVSLTIYKKIYEKDWLKSKSRFTLLTAVIPAFYAARVFYTQWVRSSLLQSVASGAGISAEILVFITAVILAAISVYFLYVVLHPIAVRISDFAQPVIRAFYHIGPKTDFIKGLVSCIIAAVVTTVLSQTMSGIEAFYMGYVKFVWCALIVLTVILFLYCLMGKAVPAIFIGSGMFMVISTINRYVYIFRDRLFEPMDVFSARTAMNVAGNYSLFPIPQELTEGWGVFAVMMVIVCILHYKPEFRLTVRKRLVLFVVCALSFAAIFSYTSTVKTHHWGREGIRNNGYILEFTCRLREMSPSEPDNYSVEMVEEIAGRYGADGDGAAEKGADYPHIIVIMDEAFSDLGVIGDFSTNKEVMPFVSSMKENTVSGYALSSVYGGNTANSEYEFLTGNSLIWLSPNAVPYQQYIRSSTYSMVSYLKELENYKCVAMHPYIASGWNRPEVYRHLGFDECYFEEDFPHENYVRNFVSDREMFEFLIEKFEEKTENPMFIFGVTVQNHGSYEYKGKNYTQHISLEDYSGQYPFAEQYLSLIHESDKAVEYLISYFENVEDDVVIVFYGDHQPKIEEAFYETVGGTADTLDKRQERYKVPFFVWANYDIEEKNVECTSLNYLSSYVYEAAGITLPLYNRFLQEMESVIPSVNANGFYSVDSGRYLTVEEASEEEMRWLEKYEILQYNNIFDAKKRSEALFPVLE